MMVGAVRSTGPVDSADPPERHIEELAAARTYPNQHKIKATIVVAIGEPADTIVQIAKERGADSIVVGTHEPSVMRRVFGQSVSDEVSHNAPCDVLIVH
jgi:nucleotide-binding universal stress UspA family protein